MPDLAAIVARATAGVVLGLAVAGSGASALSAVPAFGGVPLDFSRNVNFGFQKRAVVAGDLTGDGVPDIVMAGRGIGALESTARPEAPTQPIPFGPEGVFSDPEIAAFDDVAIGDFSGDGRPDVVAVGDGGARRFVQAVDGGRRFAPDADRPVQDPLTAVAVGRVDADTLLDVVAVGPGGGLVLRQESPGVFATPIRFLTGENLADVALGDVNGDRQPDIVVVGAGGARLLAQTAPLVFSVGEPFAPGPLASVATGRFDAGRTLDVAASRPDVNQVLVGRGQGDGTFSVGEGVDVVDNPGALAAADLDFDGVTDIIAARRESGATTEFHDSAAVLTGSRGGIFTRTSTIPVQDAGQPDVMNDVRSIAVADVDVDGRPDLLFADSGLSAAVVARNSTALTLGRGLASPGMTATPLRRQVTSPSQGIVLLARCETACTLTVSGRLVVRNPTGWVTVGLGEGELAYNRGLARRRSTRVPLPIPGASWPGILEGLKQGVPVTSRLVVTARDGAGAVQQRVLSLRLARPPAAGA